MSEKSPHIEMRVVAAQHVNSYMRRVTFGGDGLARAVSVIPDQVVKQVCASEGWPAAMTRSEMTAGLRSVGLSLTRKDLQ